MSEFLFFIIGATLGSIAAILCMCLMQINRISKLPKRGEENENEKQPDTFSSGR